MLRTHTCGELSASDVGARVTLTGWVNRRREHGGLTFVNLRDRYGITQVVFDADHSADAFAAAAEIGQEWVLAIDGTVRARPEGQANPEMSTGEVEVLADRLSVLNPSRTPPFEVARDVEVDETNRLRYRYLYLRRPRVQANILLRHRAMVFVRRFLDELAFVEVETPIIIKSTPEGARDFLVPSRLQPGRFYALPQSPQQLKQLLMVAGFDRYYQIARCFRDEDPRADRELEFTQLDVEMSFVGEEDVMAITEELLIGLMGTVAPHMRIAHVPFPRLTYDDAMSRYGSDKPDLRYGLELHDLAAVLEDVPFLASAAADGGQVKGIAAPGFLPTRREIDEHERLMRELGAGGLAWAAFEGDAVRGSLAKSLSDAARAALHALLAGEDGTVLVVAGDPPLVARCLSRLRTELARRLDLIDPTVLHPAWLVEPPLFEWNADEGRWDAVHHLFTAPHPDDVGHLTSSPGTVRARAYDVICNGYELGGGSIRIHDREEQRRVFDLLGLTESQSSEQFGHMLTAFELGAPPHGGIALGFDRTVAILCGESNIREVIAFPKALSGVDPMTGSPSDVPDDLLEVLGLRLREGEK